MLLDHRVDSRSDNRLILIDKVNRLSRNCVGFGISDILDFLGYRHRSIRGGMS